MVENSIVLGDNEGGPVHHYGMQTFCPKCGTKLGADESMVGKQAQCGKCSHRFTVMPIASAPAPEESAAAEKEAQVTAPATPPPTAERAKPTKPPAGKKSVTPIRKETKPSPAEAPKSAAVLATEAAAKSEAESQAPEAGNGCPKCGAKLAPGAALCTQCGHFLKKEGEKLRVKGAQEAKPAEAGGKCPKCDAALAAGAVLCTQCGTFLNDDAKAKTGGDKSKSLKLVVGITAFCVAAAGGYFGVRWFMSRGEEQPAATAAPAQPPAPRPAAGGQPPSPPPTPAGPIPAPGGAPMPTGAQPPRKGVAQANVDLPAVTPAELEAVSKLPAQDASPADSNVPKPSPLVPKPTLLQTVFLKGPPVDRHQAGKPPQLSPATRLVTLQFTWRQTELDQGSTINADAFKISTDAGPGMLYGTDFDNYVSFSNWQPRGASQSSSGILETVQLAHRRVADYSTDMLASGKLLARAEYGKWFDRIVALTLREDLLVVSVLNQYFEANKGTQTEQGAFYCADGRLNLHLLIPKTATTVRMQFKEFAPVSFPIGALEPIPTTLQPDPTPFINATIESAAPLLASDATDQVVAGAQLLTEAGNLDLGNKLKAPAFKNWQAAVTQLLAHASVECREAAVETILRSQHVDIKLRCELFATAIQDSSPAVRRHAAELMSEKPTLLESAFKEGMASLETLLKDSNATVRAAAMLSNARMAVLGDDSAWEFQREAVEKGFLDPSPSVRLALLEMVPTLQAGTVSNATSRLDHLLKKARLNLSDPNETIRFQTAKTILAVRSPTAAAIARDSLQKEPDKTTDLFARAALEASIGSEKEMLTRCPALADPDVQTILTPMLTNRLDDEKPRARESAARVLGSFMPDIAAEALSIAATNADIGVRLIVFSSLNAPERGAAPPAAVLAHGLNDSDPRIQGAALGLLDTTLADASAADSLASNVVASVTSPTLRLAVARKMAALSLSNAPMLFAVSRFLEDRDDNVWKTAIAPWSKTTLRFAWTNVAPVWTQLINQPVPARRAWAFYPLRLASTNASQPDVTTVPPQEALAEATKLLGDKEAYVRESALLFVAPYRTAAETEAIQKILTDPQRDVPANIKNQILQLLAKPAPGEEFSVVDRIRAATAEDRTKERATLASLVLGPAPAQSRLGTNRAPRAAFAPIDYRVELHTASPSGIYLLTRWATSANPSANAAANYLLQVIQVGAGRSWLLPSERMLYTQSLRKLAEIPAVAANAKLTLNQFETRFPTGGSAKALSPEQTQGAAESVESLVKFLAPKKRPMLIATFEKNRVLIDVWYGADETIPDHYPPDVSAKDAEAWKFKEKMEGGRMEPLDRGTLARLEWAAANAPKDKLRAALLQISQAEGDLAPISKRVALEGLVLLAESGDPESEAAAIKLGWVKL